MLQEQYGVVPLFWVLLMWPMWSETIWSQLANALLPAPAGILASFWHSKGSTGRSGSFLLLSWLLYCTTVSTLDTEHQSWNLQNNPQYLPTKRKDRKDTAESRWNWKEWEDGPHMSPIYGRGSSGSLQEGRTHLDLMGAVHDPPDGRVKSKPCTVHALYITVHHCSKY